MPWFGVTVRVLPGLRKAGFYEGLKVAGVRVQGSKSIGQRT